MAVLLTLWVVTGLMSLYDSATCIPANNKIHTVFVLFFSNKVYGLIRPTYTLCSYAEDQRKGMGKL